MDMTKFKEMQKSDVSLHAMWLKAKQKAKRNDSSAMIYFMRSSKVDEPGLLVLPEKLRDEVLYLVHDRLMAGHLGIIKTASQ